MLCMLFIDIRTFALLGKDRSNFFLSHSYLFVLITQLYILSNNEGEVDRTQSIKILFVMAIKGINMIRSNFCLPFFKPILKFIPNRCVDEIQIKQKVIHNNLEVRDHTSFILLLENHDYK